MTTIRTRPPVLQMLSGAWTAQAIYIAAKLGIADLLANGPRTVDDLAPETSTNEQALFRVLRALASNGIFSFGPNRTVELSPLAEPLASAHPDSVRSFALMVNEEIYEGFADLLYTVKTNEPAFDKRFGMPVFHYHDCHPEAAATFHQAMNDWSRWDTADIIQSYDFSPFRKAVDVGGGNGAFLSALLAKHPQLSAVLLDRETAIQAARAGAGGPLPRCELITGDFLDSVPTGADLYIIKHVMDGWPDEDVVKILANCRNSMSEGGRVLVLESMIVPGNAPSFVKWLDVMIMTVTPGEFRSETDFPPLFARAGLRLNRILRISESVSLLEGVAP